MINSKRVVVVMPAYNAARTLEQTVAEIPREVVDDLVLVDDASRDDTTQLAARLGIPAYVHRRNFGYGRNQKTCYRIALGMAADIVVMLHPDYQYTPRLIHPMAAMVASGEFDVVLGSRILGGGAIAGGMPRYKYAANRLLTLFQNIVQHSKLSEFHTGYRVFSRAVLESLPLGENDDDFVFDNQMLAQALYFGFRVGEVTCPTRYFAESSSIDFRRSVKYGLGVLQTATLYRLNRWGLARSPIFDRNGRKLFEGDEAEYFDPTPTATG